MTLAEAQRQYQCTLEAQRSHVDPEDEQVVAEVAAARRALEVVWLQSAADRHAG
jgi:hypothetical protein